MVNNTYIHAYSEQEGKPVKVKCNLNEDSETKTICIDIIDRGEPMTQTQLEKALSNEFVDMDPDDDSTWATSGRGFMIVSALMDDIKLRVEDGENCFMMTKELEESDLIENVCPP
jgi:anti-sigma regulatory factor (Ser/Thr protein kinase)